MAHKTKQQHSKLTRRATTGVVILGMHRSGTSALAHLLHEAGVDMGSRLVPGSAGNEEGHWEDAFAVETNERLLSDLGRRWDDVRALPADWLGSSMAVEARARIRAYVRESRKQHRLWAMKDPRMCLFAELWLSAMAEEGVEPAVVLMGRHPTEVAASLAARDGLAEAHSNLLWLRHVLSSELASRGMRRAFVTYPQLVDDAPGVLARVARECGFEMPERAGAKAGDPVVRKAARHHVSDADGSAGLLGDAWRAFLSRAASGGAGTPEEFDALNADFEVSERLFDPVLREMHRAQDQLWLRTARAEGALAEHAEEDGRSVSAYGDRIESALQRINEAVSLDLRRMQQAHADAIASASGVAGEVGLARDLSPRVEQLQAATESLADRLVETVSVELRRMQDAHSRAIEAASSLSAEAALARQLAPKVDMIQAGLVHVGERIMQVYNEDVRAIRAELQRMERERDDAIAARHSSLAEQAAAHAREIEAREARAQELEVAHGEAMSERDRHIEGLVDELAEARARLESFEARTASLEADLGRMRAMLPPLQADADMLARVRDSLSWRITRPIRFLRRLLQGRLLASDRTKLRSWWARQVAGTRLFPQGLRRRMQLAAIGARPPEPGPAGLPGLTDMARKQDVFVWAVIDWHFRIQRPQHLARALSEAGHRVFYVSNNLVDSTEAGFQVEQLDDAGRLFQVNLNASGAPAIYFDAPCDATAGQLRGSLGALMQWAGSDGGLCIVQHPFWSTIATAVPGATLVYDCMDHHAGFENNAPNIIEAESKLTKDADLLVVTSDWLDRELAAANGSRVLIRNATEFEHFNARPGNVYRDEKGRRVIGYFGAIAEWFDVELVRRVAEAYPDCCVLLVGNDTMGAGVALGDLDNVRFTGEVPYASLPGYLHGFDVALLPFRVIPLTLATNPVKVYEYLSAGKPVVAVDLPEVAQFGELVRVAASHEAFVSMVGEALREGDEPGRARARIAFASEQTWGHRALEFDEAIANLRVPRVSVVVLTYNNLEFTKACLASIEQESNWANLEVIVVDNASTDGSREFLRQWETQGANRKVLLQDSNLGFSAGNNVGLAAASGDYLVLLNNDTYVTANWVGTLVNHLKRDASIGIIGPVTNNIGNEARIEIHYEDMAGMKVAAADYTRRHAGELFDLRTVAFFCVAMPRSTYEVVGPLDEAFGVGFFEDDDYCRRVEEAGLRVVCAEDVFVHHHLSASFNALHAERKQELFRTNKEIYERKWGPWEPHAYREQRS